MMRCYPGVYNGDKVKFVHKLGGKKVKLWFYGGHVPHCLLAEHSNLPESPPVLLF